MFIWYKYIWFKYIYGFNSITIKNIKKRRSIRHIIDKKGNTKSSASIALASAGYKTATLLLC